MLKLKLNYVRRRRHPENPLNHAVKVGRTKGVMEAEADVNDKITTSHVTSLTKLNKCLKTPKYSP